MAVTDNKILIIDNVFTQDECCALIEYYTHKGPTHKWQNFLPMTIQQDDEFLRPQIKRIENLAQSNFDKNIIIDWCEVVRWLVDAFQDLHFDTSNKNTILTSITYLNDQYEGGQTFIHEDIEIIPKIGRTVIFNGQFYKHGVKKVLSGSRYTLPIWYKMNEETTIK